MHAAVARGNINILLAHYRLFSILFEKNKTLEQNASYDNNLLEKINICSNGWIKSNYFNKTGNLQ